MNTARETVTMYCPDSSLAVDLRFSAPTGAAAMPTACWDTFQRSAACRDSLVAVLPGDVTTDQVRRLAMLQREHPDHPLVLAVDPNAENLRRLSRLEVAEMIWLEELNRKLWPALRQARTDGALHRFARRFEEADWITARLRKALAAGCRSVPPPCNVAQLAALVRRDRRTLWRIWQDTFGPTPPLRLQNFVQWLLLIRAATLRSTGLRWTVVAHDMSIHEDTIARMAKKLAGMDLRQVAAGGPVEVTRHFEQKVVARLLECGNAPHTRRQL
jgi:hypothetical protein